LLLERFAGKKKRFSHGVLDNSLLAISTITTERQRLHSDKDIICCFAKKLPILNIKIFHASLPIDYKIYVTLLQPLRWRCVECVIHHERHVREE